MADTQQYLSEIRIFSFNYPPAGWAQCNGQLLPINQNQALFALLGTTYGGNGQTTFGLPDLRGRYAMHVGNGHTLGERAGETTHTLLLAEMPQHFHTVAASAANGTQPVPGANFLAQSPNQVYSSSGPTTTLSAGTVGNAGGNQPHENMQPYLVLEFCIALQGIFPSRN